MNRLLSLSTRTDADDLSLLARDDVRVVDYYVTSTHPAVVKCDSLQGRALQIEHDFTTNIEDVAAKGKNLSALFQRVLNQPASPNTKALRSRQCTLVWNKFDDNKREEIEAIAVRKAERLREISETEEELEAGLQTAFNNLNDGFKVESRNLQNLVREAVKEEKRTASQGNHFNRCLTRFDQI